MTAHEAAKRLQQPFDTQLAAKFRMWPFPTADVCTLIDAVLAPEPATEPEKPEPDTTERDELAKELWLRHGMAPNVAFESADDFIAERKRRAGV